MCPLQYGIAYSAQEYESCIVITRTAQNHRPPCAYKGILRSGESFSEVIPELQIIEESMFDRAQILISERAHKRKDSTTPLSTKGMSLFSRNIFCGHCGARLVLTTNGKRKVTDENGDVKIIPKLRYVCYNKTRHHDCDGQTGYTVPKLDGIVEGIILRLFERLQDVPPEKLVGNEIKNKQDTTHAILANAEKAFTKHKDEYDAYKAEVIKALQGKSKFSEDVLNELLSSSKAAMEEAEAVIAQNKKELEDSGEVYREVQKNLKELLSWTDLYQNSSMASKRMIMSQLIQAVRVRRDYELEINFNIVYEQFCMGF